ncbi:MAG: sugar ABC transporter permease [Thermomicrobiales bacterium]|nr:sugar ABC transporter permease [Thermomicrobiales bacterium]
MATTAPPPAAPASRGRGLLGQGWVAWLFLLPTIIFFIGWQLWPILRVAWISLTDYKFLNTTDPVHFIGLDNFRSAIADPLMRLGLLRAAGFTALFLPGMIFLPMFLAVLIDRIQSPKLSTFYRLILLIPAMIPGPLIFLLWRWMYDLYIGPINYILVDVLHVFTVYSQPQWIGDPRLVFPALAGMEWWWGMGYHTMFFLAGLATISRDLFDAARVDGANEWRMFWDVTFPRLLPIVLVLVVLRFGSAMAVIDEYLIMGGVNRDRPTFTWTVYMWELAFQRPPRDLGYAAAIGWVGTIAMLVVVALLFRIFRTRD